METAHDNRFRTRGSAAKLAFALSLVAPATAIAAPSIVDESGPREDARSKTERPAATESPATDAVALISGFGVGAVVEVPEGPYHPVDGDVDYGSVEAAFGNARGRPHEGQDIMAPAGTPVISPMQTEVIETGSDGGRGNWAALYDKSEDRTFVYFHMIEPAEVRAGQRLAAGDRVGQVGCTGSCYGDHLHFEIRDGRDPYGAASDPLPELQSWKRLPGD